MNYIAICEKYDGLIVTKWIRDVENFEEAVAAAIALKQELLPEIAPKVQYSNSSDRHWHEKDIFNRKCENGERIKSVRELKIWSLK